ncbi:alpha/beta fold hydrolase [Streptomyces sp. NPDC058662]|uniref:alpha/beta fold hydrolase n=1 Tax=Streptomyces sp. NPDC058662 TaxID=3346583 RepID=UPI003654AFB6
MYDDAGIGPLAVYAHGGLASQALEQRMDLFDWTPVLRAGRRLVRYDARGHGRSTGRPVDEDYTYPSLADDLLGLLDHLGTAEAVDAIGASMGCGTCLHAAVLAPDRFSRLVLLLPPTAWSTREPYARANRAAADTVERHGAAAWLSARGERPRPAVVADVPDLPPAPPEPLLPSVLRGLARSDLPPPAVLVALRCPVLILTWADDPGHPVSTAAALADCLPDAELHVSRTRADVRTWGSRIADFLTALPARTRGDARVPPGAGGPGLPRASGAPGAGQAEGEGRRTAPSHPARKESAMNSAPPEPELPDRVPEKRDAVTPDLPPLGPTAPDLPVAAKDRAAGDDPEDGKGEQAPAEGAPDEAAPDEAAGGNDAGEKGERPAAGPGNETPQEPTD